MHFKIKSIKGHKYLYLIENKRINGKVKQIRQICVGSPEKVYEMIHADAEVIVASYPFTKRQVCLPLCSR